jgi:RNA polymerase sigma factor (TIGR02999 family)
MANADQVDLTALLVAWKAGDRGALDRLVAVLYPDLRRLARRRLRGWPRAGSQESVTLVNEAYLKLVRAGAIGCENRLHFLALCAQVMRRLFVDHERERRAARRGGGAVEMPIDSLEVAGREPDVDVLALDEALEALSRLDHRKSRLVELRYFAGLTLPESAAVLGVALITAKRDWRMARSWLHARLAGEWHAEEPS